MAATLCFGIALGAACAILAPRDLLLLALGAAGGAIVWHVHAEVFGGNFFEMMFASALAALPLLPHVEPSVGRKIPMGNPHGTRE